MKVPHLPVGIEDFSSFIQKEAHPDGSKFTIADKTRFLPNLLISSNDVMVFTRPIRFMKSSTLSMMARFLSVKDADLNKNLFDGLDISHEKYVDFREKYQGKYPVIHLTFKSIKRNLTTWREAREEISEIMSNLYEENSYILPSLSEMQQKRYERILKEEGSDRDLQRSLANMATYLAKHYNKKVIILIDEYDTPVHRAQRNTKKQDRENPNSYFQAMLSFLSGFFSDALKGHPSVEKGFITGVSYIAFSSFFSDLNNVNVYSIFTPEYGELFGFTESEVEQFILQVEGITEKERNKMRSVIQGWYNGYYIGNKAIRMYNPWSVAKFFNSLPSNPEMVCKPYWLQVGDTLGISEYFNPRFDLLHSQITELMLDKTIRVEAYEHMRMNDLDSSSSNSSFWGLLLHAGYLSASNIRYANESIVCDVAIPNYEVKSAYAYLIRCYQSKYDPDLKYINNITRSLLDGDISEFSRNLTILMEQAVSFYDLPKAKNDEKNVVREQVYHAFILGLLSGTLTDYKIKSNQESGYGRYDISLIPREEGRHGFIFEFKSISKKASLQKAAKMALEQIEEKRYSAELEEAKVASGIHIGMSFYGKCFHMEYRKSKIWKFADSCRRV